MEATARRVMALGYGLTMGVHSRIGGAADAIRRIARVGNLYVNRSMIGAVVGVQPFGGEGLSGTGPKAGGPHYLPRFMAERTWTVDTTSAGGNTSLLAAGAVTLVPTFDDVLAADLRLERHAVRTPRPAVRRPRRPRRPAGVAEVRDLPARRVVQVPRRLQPPLPARSGGAGAGRRRLFLGQPRPGRRARGPEPGRRGDHRDAGRRTGHQARPHTGPMARR